jgi:hypothetical protein
MRCKVPRAPYARGVTDDDLIGNAAAAAYVGLSTDAWRPYVARGHAPPPYRREVRGGHALPVWHQSGQGARTDLARGEAS